MGCNPIAIAFGGTTACMTLAKHVSGYGKPEICTMEDEANSKYFFSRDDSKCFFSRDVVIPTNNIDQLTRCCCDDVVTTVAEMCKIYRHNSKSEKPHPTRAEMRSAPSKA
eukprot:4418510-Ditylum_brightwellii.AAC.1